MSNIGKTITSWNRDRRVEAEGFDWVVTRDDGNCLELETFSSKEEKEDYLNNK